MDVFAHTIWASIAAKAGNKKLKDFRSNPLSVGWASFWGVFPDLFAFGLGFINAFWVLLVSGGHGGAFMRPENANAPELQSQLSLAHGLYNISHSGVVFLTVFLLIWLIRRKPYWELLGWLLHILLDIPTHTDAFFPTPVFWPLSDAHFTHGISWGTPWFMAVNYTAIALSFAYFFLKRKRSTS